MPRYLLFDSGCASCTRLAQAIEREAGGWVRARSLRDAEIQALLGRARPGWTWEPTLLEVAGERVRVWTGFALRVRLVLGLGITRAWRIARLVHRMSLGLTRKGRRRFPQDDVAASRRSFLRSIRVVAGLAILPQSMGSAIPSQQGYDKNPLNTRYLLGPEAEDLARSKF